MHVHFNTWNEVGGNLFHPFQPPFENVATSVVASLLVQKIIVVCIGDYVAVSSCTHPKGSKKRELTPLSLKG